MPWHILAERFLLYRKAISCKARKSCGLKCNEFTFILGLQDFILLLYLIVMLPAVQAVYHALPASAESG